MTARVLVIGLDAAEATILEGWASEGFLPNIARLMHTGSVARLANSLDTLPGAIWPEINSGRSCGKAGIFYTPLQIHTGEAEMRPIEAQEFDTAKDYWSIASRAGRRVCVIDQPHCALNTTLNGIQITEWGLHDRLLTEQSQPPPLLSEVNERYGRHPVRTCDAYPDSRQGRDALLGDLLKGLESKEALALDLMGREHWDLYACTLTEGHCVGHHFWRFLDPASPWRVADAPEAHRDAIRTVYQRMDDVVGALIEAAGREAVALVLASHGMGPAYAGCHLLPEVLARLGMSSDRGRAKGSLLRAIQRRIRYSVPRRWVPALRAISALGPVRAIQRPIGGLRFPLQSASTRAVVVPNNRVGAIRLNLMGREPCGAVEPGAEAADLIDELRAELLKLEHPRTGAPVVERVMTADEVFGPDHHPDLPDMMVLFRTDQGPIEACRSERVGTLEIPYFARRNHRSGDHTVESRLWAAGPGIPAGVRLPQANVLDIAPTVLGLLGVPLPDDLDGRPITFAPESSGAT